MVVYKGKGAFVKRGRCKMCLEETDLVMSHLMPAALYGYCRADNSSPVKVGLGVVMSTDRQTQDYVLCQPCEDILNHGGENWVNPKLATMRRTFLLYELLAQGPADVIESDAAAYRAALNPAIDAEKMVHYAAGLFWKASVHPWLGGRKEPRIDLGPYSDALRRFLRREEPFPAHMMLNVSLSFPSSAQIVMTDPHEGEREQSERTYFCHVPGVLFVLTIGKTIPAELKQLCFATNPSRPILVSHDITERLQRVFATSYTKSRKTRSFLEMRARRNGQSSDGLIK
jgi:hypothetical protein